MAQIKTCDICGRTEAEARLHAWETYRITYTICIDEEGCEAAARNREHHTEPPPTDQALRHHGYAELPGMGAS